MATNPSLTDALDHHRHALLTTFRRNGQPVTTIIWLAVANDRVHFRTGAETGKAKRLARNPRARIAPCTSRGRALGPAVEVTARRLGPEEGAVAREAIAARYGVMLRLVDLIIRLRHVETIFFELAAA